MFANNVSIAIVNNPKKVIFQDLNIIIPLQEVTIVCGSNGSGKTKLLEALSYNSDKYGLSIKRTCATTHSIYPWAVLVNDIDVGIFWETSLRNVYTTVKASKNDEQLQVINFLCDALNFDKNLFSVKVKNYYNDSGKLAQLKLKILICLLYEENFLAIDDVLNDLTLPEVTELAIILRKLRDVLRITLVVSDSSPTTILFNHCTYLILLKKFKISLFAKIVDVEQDGENLLVIKNMYSSKDCKELATVNSKLKIIKDDQEEELKERIKKHNAEKPKKITNLSTASFIRIFIGQYIKHLTEHKRTVAFFLTIFMVYSFVLSRFMIEFLPQAPLELTNNSFIDLLNTSLNLISVSRHRFVDINNNVNQITPTTPFEVFKQNNIETSSVAPTNRQLNEVHDTEENNHNNDNSLEHKIATNLDGFPSQISKILIKSSNKNLVNLVADIFDQGVNRRTNSNLLLSIIKNEAKILQLVLNFGACLRTIIPKANIDFKDWNTHPLSLSEEFTDSEKLTAVFQSYLLLKYVQLSLPSVEKYRDDLALMLLPSTQKLSPYLSSLICCAGLGSTFSLISQRISKKCTQIYPHINAPEIDFSGLNTTDNLVLPPELQFTAGMFEPYVEGVNESNNVIYNAFSQIIDSSGHVNRGNLSKLISVGGNFFANMLDDNNPIKDIITTRTGQLSRNIQRSDSMKRTLAEYTSVFKIKIINPLDGFTNKITGKPFLDSDTSGRWMQYVRQLDDCDSGTCQKIKGVLLQIETKLTKVLFKGGKLVILTLITILCSFAWYILSMNFLLPITFYSGNRVALTSRTARATVYINVLLSILLDILIVFLVYFSITHAIFKLSHMTFWFTLSVFTLLMNGTATAQLLNRSRFDFGYKLVCHYISSSLFVIGAVLVLWQYLAINIEDSSNVFNFIENFQVYYKSYITDTTIVIALIIAKQIIKLLRFCQSNPFVLPKILIASSTIYQIAVAFLLILTVRGHEKYRSVKNNALRIKQNAK